MSTNDDGPTYPSSRDMRFNPDFDHEPGMSLRDHFAGLAMSAMLGPNHPYGGKPEEFIPAGAYRMADAMLRAREIGQ